MLDVRRSPELQAALLGVRQAERTIRTNINRVARTQMRPLWQAALAQRASSSLERRVLLPSARVAVGAKNVSAVAATSKRPLSGGLVPSVDWPAVEFGARSHQAEFQQRSRSGNTYTRKMWVSRAFKGRVKQGYVVFDASSELGTKLVGIWVNTIVDEFRRFADIKGGR